MEHRVRFISILFLLLIIGCNDSPKTPAPQEFDSPSPQHLSKTDENKAYTVPVSDKRVRLTLTIFDTVMQVTVLEGGMARLIINDERVYGLSPYLPKHENDNKALLLLTQIEAMPNGSEKITELQKLIFPMGDKKDLPQVEPTVSVQISSVLAKEQVEPETVDRKVPPPSPGKCCITCTVNGYEITVCGCAVQSSCGSCCVYGCC